MNNAGLRSTYLIFVRSFIGFNAMVYKVMATHMGHAFAMFINSYYVAATALG